MAPATAESAASRSARRSDGSSVKHRARSDTDKAVSASAIGGWSRAGRLRTVCADATSGAPRPSTASVAAARRATGPSRGASALRRSMPQVVQTCCGISAAWIAGVTPRPQTGQRSSSRRACRRHAMLVAIRHSFRKWGKSSVFRHCGQNCSQVARRRLWRIAWASARGLKSSARVRSLLNVRSSIRSGAIPVQRARSSRKGRGRERSSRLDQEPEPSPSMDPRVLGGRPFARASRLTQLESSSSG